MTTREFVVQRHDVAPGDVHFDLMIEAGERLATVQLAEPPGGEATPGRRSFPHRRAYLEYEGTISGDRGTVAIWDRGQVVDLEGAPDAPRYCGEFTGEHLHGRFELVGTGDDGVELRRVTG